MLRTAPPTARQLLRALLAKFREERPHPDAPGAPLDAGHWRVVTRERDSRHSASVQVAVAKGLLSAAQHSRRGRPIALTVHNVTTARDLQAHRASAARRRTSHGQLARNNLSTLKGLNAQPGVTVTVRADAGPPPARLQRIADQAAQSGDLRSKHPADPASCANAPWDELRVWDPGD